MAATLLELRQRILVQLNDYQVTSFATGNGDRYKIPMINQTINDVVRFYEKKLNQFYQGYFSVTLPLNVTANVPFVTLPATFRSPIYEVRRIVNQTNYVLDVCQPYMFDRTTQSIPNDSWLPGYWLEGRNLMFTAAPAASQVGAVLVRFQRKLLPLVTDGTELDDELYDAEGCIVTRASCRLLKAKDVSGAIKDISGWERELADDESAFFAQAGRRYVKQDKPIPYYDAEEFTM